MARQNNPNSHSLLLTNVASPHHHSYYCQMWFGVTVGFNKNGSRDNYLCTGMIESSVKWACGESGNYVSVHIFMVCFQNTGSLFIAISSPIFLFETTWIVKKEMVRVFIGYDDVMKKQRKEMVCVKITVFLGHVMLPGFCLKHAL